MEIFIHPLNIFTWRPVTRFDISKKVSSEFSLASMLPCGIWKMPYGLKEFTQHHHEVAQMMNFHLVGAQSPTHSSGLGRDRSDVRSKNTTSLVSKHRTLAVVQTTHSNATVAYFSGLWCQNTIIRGTQMTTFFTAEVRDRERWCLPPRLRAAVIFPTARLLKDEKMTKITIKGVRKWRYMGR